MSDYNYKFNSFVASQLENKENIKIVEFGVKEGRSTKIFLEYCKKNKGKLFSVDIDDYKHKFNDPNWVFIKSRDDNFDYLNDKLPTEIDLIYLDSLHEAEHVKKIFYHYYDRLKLNGLFFIDDISWLPYLKKEERDNFYCEINNQETFKKLLEIYYSNIDNFDLTFNFTSSGSCKILKKKNLLNPLKKIETRTYSFKNFIRKSLKIFRD